MSDLARWPDGQDGDEPIDALTSEPPEFGEPRASVLTPMGSIESLGDFYRGLGARRSRIVMFGFGAIALLLALMAALQ